MLINDALMKRMQNKYGNKFVEIDRSRLDFKRLITLYGPDWFICYDNVPLWRSNTEPVAVFLYNPQLSEDEEEQMEPLTLFCIDSTYEDIYTYGRWESLEDANKWLSNPEMLY